jgi:hypothetical protein
MIKRQTLALAAACLLVACEERPAANPVADSATTEAAPPAPVVDPLPPLPEDMDEAARLVVAEMIEAYRSAPALEDRITIRFRNEGILNRKPQVIELKMGPGADCWLKMAWIEWTANEGYVYMIDTGLDDRYLVTPLIQDLQMTLKTTFGTAGGLPAHFGLRYESKEGQRMQRLAMGVLRNRPKISACRRETDAEGNVVDKLTLTSTEGFLTLYVDPRTRLITFAEGEKSLGPGGPQVMIAIEMTFSPRIREADEMNISFNPGLRRAVSTMEEMDD